MTVEEVFERCGKELLLLEEALEIRDARIRRLWKEVDEARQEAQYQGKWAHKWHLEVIKRQVPPQREGDYL